MNYQSGYIGWVKMAGNTSEKKPIEQYEHKGKTRCNNPPAGIANAENEEPKAKKYDYDPHLDPQSGGRERWATCLLKYPRFLCTSMSDRPANDHPRRPKKRCCRVAANVTIRL